MLLLLLVAALAESTERGLKHMHLQTASIYGNSTEL